MPFGTKILKIPTRASPIQDTLVVQAGPLRRRCNVSSEFPEHKLPGALTLEPAHTPPHPASRPPREDGAEGYGGCCPDKRMLRREGGCACSAALGQGCAAESTPGLGAAAGGRAAVARPLWAQGSLHRAGPGATPHPAQPLPTSSPREILPNRHQLPGHLPAFGSGRGGVCRWPVAGGRPYRSALHRGPGAKVCGQHCSPRCSLGSGWPLGNGLSFRLGGLLSTFRGLLATHPQRTGPSGDLLPCCHLP